MPTRSEAYPPKWLNADALGDEPVRAKIKRVTYELVGEKEKWVMHWDGPPWTPFPLNPTNFDAVAAALGKPNSDDWPGDSIEVRKELVRNPAGKMVPGVRLYGVPKPGASATIAPNAKARRGATESPPVEAYEDLNDEIPDDEAA